MSTPNRDKNGMHDFEFCTLRDTKGFFLPWGVTEAIFVTRAGATPTSKGVFYDISGIPNISLRVGKKLHCLVAIHKVGGCRIAAFFTIPIGVALLNDFKNLYHVNRPNP